jgi:hypothetical protein
MDGMITALYIFMLAAFTGYEVISRVPVILHTPLMSGSNFVHGVVLVGSMVALGHADPESPLQLLIGFFACSSARPTRPAATSSPSACWACSRQSREVSNDLELVRQHGELLHRRHRVHLRPQGDGLAGHGAQGHGVGRLRHGAATLATFFIPGLHNIGLMVVPIALGGGVAWSAARWSR